MSNEPLPKETILPTLKTDKAVRRNNQRALHRI